MSRLIISLVALAACLGQPAAGQELLAARDLSVRMASGAAMAALAECTRLGHRVAVVVTDRGGHVRAAVRGDGAGPHLFDAARQKAYTAASSGSSTLVWAENLRRGLRAPDPNLVHLEGVLIIGGDCQSKLAIRLSARSEWPAHLAPNSTTGALNRESFPYETCCAEDLPRSAGIIVFGGSIGAR